MRTAANNKAWVAVALMIGVLTATIPTFLLFRAVTFLFVIPLLLGLLSISLGLAALRRGSGLSKLAAVIAVVLLVVAVAVPFGLIAYHNRTGFPIVVIVPDNYRGPVLLVIDRDGGVDVPLRDGVYEYRIPASGKLLIRNDQPFRVWHNEKAVYASGKPLPMKIENNLPADMIVLHSLGSGSHTKYGTTEEYIEYFVGTQAELRKYVDRQ